MNKAKVDKLIPYAYDAIGTSGIAKDGKVSKAFRGQISTFGAAVTTGSLLSAIAFFSDDGSAKVKRSKLIDAILIVLKADGAASKETQNLYRWVEQMKSKGQEPQCREQMINAAIAIKLAMNLYTLTD